MLRHIDHDGDVARLARQTCAASASQHRGSIFAASSDSPDDIIDIFRYHHANRYLTIIGGVGRIERAAAFIEAHLTLYLRAQFSFWTHFCVVIPQKVSLLLTL